jgi:predicted Rossmann-fold nucleotide-binding protein
MMREVNKGAKESGGESWGICIEHRAEEIILDYFTYHEVHERFDERNDRLLSLGDAFIVLPGGLGTIVEALQITQRKKFAEVPPKTPLVFVGEFYRKLTQVFDEMRAENFISDNLPDLYQFVQSPQEMMPMLKTYFATLPEKSEEVVLNNAILTSN